MVLAVARPPFFVLGCPRSGTTLLSQLLDNHPATAVFVESLYYPLFRADLHRYGDLRRPRNLRRLIGNFDEMVRLHGLYKVEPPSRGEVEAAVTAPTFENVLVTFLQLYASRQGKEQCGEKTARHHEYVSEIHERLPDSPLVFAMRDPRDVAFSIRAMFGARVETAAEWWNRAFRSYVRVAASAHVVRYETLVQDPRAEIGRLCAFLGHEFDPSMLDFFQHVPARLRDAPHHRRLTTPVTAASVGRFRDEAPAEVALVEAACAEGMEVLGYVPETTRAVARPAPSVTVLERAAERARRLRRRPYVLGWHRWKMRFRVRARYVLTLGPARSH